MRHVISTVLFVAAFAAVATYTGVAQQNQMSFFVSSAGVGNGANLGGLAGADEHCQALVRARRVRAAGRGMPTSARPRPPVSRRSTRASASATGHGTTRRAPSSPSPSPTCTVTSSATGIRSTRSSP